MLKKKTDRNSPIKSLTVKLSNDLKFLTRFLNGINESFSEEYAKESDSKYVIFMRDSNRTSGYIPFKFDLTKEYIKQFLSISSPPDINKFVLENIKDKIKTDPTLRPILDAVLKQDVLRIFQHGLVRLGRPLF